MQNLHLGRAGWGLFAYHGSAAGIPDLELHNTDLSLWATKEIHWSYIPILMATKRHLWLNLLDMQGKDRSFNSVLNLVIKRFQEVRRQAAAFRRFLPFAPHASS